MRPNEQLVDDLADAILGRLKPAVPYALIGPPSYKYLTLSVRSMDLGSAVLVRFETDAGQKPFGILEVMPDGGTFDPGTVDYPYRYTTTLGAAHMGSSARYPTNDTWTTLKIPLQTECAPYPCFRVISVKTIGAVSVGLIRLTEPEVIPQ